MRTALLVSLLSLLLPLSAFPQHFPPWQAPKPGDARSACPGINALANHGLLPHSGRNIDLETLRRAFKAGFNIDNIDADPPAGLPRVADALFDMAITTNIDRNNTKTFDMDTVSRHDYPYGPIEFDGSLSRDDFYSGDQVHFNPEIFAETRDVIEKGLAHGQGTGHGTEIDIPLAAKARSVRIYNQSKRNPKFFFNGTNLSRSFGSSAFYISTLGDPINGVVKAEYMKIFFEHERIPFLEGYNPRTKGKTTTETLLALMAKFPAVSPPGIPCIFTPEQAPCPASGAAAVGTRSFHDFHSFHGF